MVRANYHDGRTTRVCDVALSLCGADLAVVGDGINRLIPLKNIAVDERLGRAPRRLSFADGAFCEVRDLEALDSLLSAMGHRDGLIDRLQRHLPFVGFAIVAFAAVVTAAYLWILPWAVQIAARRIPASIDVALSTQTLKSLDGNVFQASELPQERREALLAAFRGLQLPDGSISHSTLLFRKSAQLPANAFTLPDGTIVLLDDLVALMNDQEVLAVLGHELGHAYNRHGLQMLLRTSVVAAFWTFYVGDISNLLAAAPAAIVQARYSQNFEREADDYGAQTLLRNGMSPGMLADALEKLKTAYPGRAVGEYLSTHPATDDRMMRLREQATNGLGSK